MSKADELTPPPLTIEIKIGEETKTIKMSYGLEMDIRRVMPEPNEALRAAMLDPFTQDYVIRRCLTEKRAMITNADDLIDIEEMDISTEDTHALMVWAVEHALYFFAKRAADLTGLTAQYGLEKKTSDQPPPLTDGSEASPSPTQSAGPSE